MIPAIKDFLQKPTSLKIVFCPTDPEISVNYLAMYTLKTLAQNHKQITVDYSLVSPSST